MLLTAPEAARLLRVSTSTLYRWIQRGTMPPPIRLSPGAVAFQSEVLESWLRERAPGANLDASQVAGSLPRGRGGRKRKAVQ